MASPNRHWPSMFKSKPCNNIQHNQWQHHQHDLNNSPLISSTNCHRSPYSSAVGVCEERSPEPKPRWNPKPEQIRILEAIFNSGMVNPPRDEIRKIRGQLQEYGQVGDANVFYWFQNRKSRSKHKQRHQVNNSRSIPAAATPPPLPPPVSSSAENVVAAPVSNTPDGPVVGGQSNMFYEPLMPFEPFLFPVQQVSSGTNVTCTSTGAVFGQGFGLSHHEMMNNAGLVNVAEDPTAVNCSGILMNDEQQHQMIMSEKKMEEEEKLMKVMSYSTFSSSSSPLLASSTASSVVTAAAVTAPSSFNHILGMENESGPPMVRYTVFINDVAFEVALAPLNVREAFGDDAVLFNSSGQPVLTDDWGVTLQPLQHGCLYYLLRALIS
ncbi:WUSCHEL-related homeobox 9-like [Impatiens glandulifera]|uniref:WUSCHEL-related homeobox 9-like n=1 Tax=Impatiens glandulifera TaxID=253017 RepID=UPI001FB1689F|nr:WUSCHEL-related homeobox 9-like [Impatiens glandulifera]